MTNDLIEQLQRAIETTFESIVLPFQGVAMEDVESGSPSDESHNGVRVRATIEFEGDIEGHVLIHCSLGGAHDISRGMLMLEEGDPLEIEDVVDAIGECANLVAGVLKRNAFDGAGEVRMGCPKVEVEPPEAVFPKPDAQLAYKLVRGVSAAIMASTSQVWALVLTRTGLAPLPSVTIR